jgi:two-component system chemotaxis response regulator CheY
VARILVVDDNLLARKVLREILNDAGHDVVGEAQDGLEAPCYLRQLHPDLVTLDLVMPGRGGLEALNHMLLIDPTLAVVVCSASLDQARVIAALRLGARGFIVKPLERQKVLEAVNCALRHVDCGKRLIANDRLGRLGASLEHLHGLCRGLAEQLRGVLEGAVDRHKRSLDELLALDYEELRGPLIHRLDRLFEVGQIGQQCFVPPKFQTAYDALVDEQMMERMDGVLAAEPRLMFALPFDLNVYAPAHNRAFTCDWTGNPTADLAHNRTKRFFLESAVLTRAARMGLGIQAPQRRLSRHEIERAGGQLHEPSHDSTDQFLVATYVRDTGAVFRTLSVPLYVMHERYGAVAIGWDPACLPL